MGSMRSVAPVAALLVVVPAIVGCDSLCFDSESCSPRQVSQEDLVGLWNLISIEGAELPARGVTQGSIEMKDDQTYVASTTNTGGGVDTRSGGWELRGGNVFEVDGSEHAALESTSRGRRLLIQWSFGNSYRYLKR